MAEDELRHKRKRFLEAYVESKEVTHKRAFTPPPDKTRVDLPTLTVRSRAPAAPTGHQRERIPIRELAMKRSRPSYLREDIEVPPEERRLEAERQRPSDDKLSPFLYRKRSGFKLVKDGVDRKGPGVADGKPRKKLSLYDLYATHDSGHDDGAQDEEGSTEAQDGERAFSRRDAQDILFSPRTPKKDKHPEGPILKEGPGPTQPMEEEDVMGAGTMVEPEHEAHVEDGGVHLEHERAPGPSAEGRSEPEPVSARTAGGEICPSCGEPFSPYNKFIVCSSCGWTGCNKCNSYDMEHAHTNVFYDYKFDFPLCIRCYDKAFKIQKLLGKAQMCYGNGNLTYALYYAQNALRMEPEGRYKDDVDHIILKIQEARQIRDVHQDQWTKQHKSMARAKFQDPAWEK